MLLDLRQALLVFVHAHGDELDHGLVDAQAAFDRKYGLGFPLLADTDHAIAEAYDVWGEKVNYGKTYMGIIRSSFLVGEDGRIEHAWYKVSPKDTVPKARAALTHSRRSSL